MKYCKKCGNKYENTYVFCPNCKSYLEDIQNIQDIKSKSDSGKNSASKNDYTDLSSYSSKESYQRNERNVRREFSENGKNAALHGKKSAKSKKKKTLKRVLITLASILLVIVIGVFGVVKFYLSKVEQDPTFDPGNLGIEEDTHTDERIINVALFGTDSRSNDDTGRSDALMILSIDKKHNKIKLTSIARDTYVPVEGHGKTKITNAWRFGAISKEKSGSTLAVKTLNQNFNLDITDYVEVNFFQFAEIIDYLGGVEIDVDKSEMHVMNVEYVPYLNQMGIKCEPIKKTGLQLLSGGQALAYSRNRYTGNDVTRGSRQREVLIALYEKTKDTSVTKYPALISKLLSKCITSLSDSEITSLCSWAALHSPSIEQLSLPNDECNAKGQTINGQWYYVYDIDNAANIVHNFIYEPEEPKVTSSKDQTSSENGSSK